MAKADQIPSDLTLELGGDIIPDRFLTAVRAFFACVQEVSKAVTADDDAPEWIVRTREGSHLIGVDPAPGAKAQVIHAIYSRMRDGLDVLTDDGIDQLVVLADEQADLDIAVATSLPEGAIRHLKTLAELGDRPAKNPVAVRFWVERKPTVLGKRMAETINESWGEDYRDYGTVEGKLDAVQDQGTLKIRVHDNLLRQTVACHISEDMLPKAFVAFRKRVEISGVIHYRRNGKPLSIDVESIEPLPDEADLPTLDDVRGILKI